MQGNIPKYYVFHFFLNFQLWWPIWVIYLTEERGLSLAQVTLIDVPFWISVILLQIPAAALADRWGRKPTLIAAAGAFSVAIIWFGLATDFWLILGSYLCWGVGWALLFGTESAFIYDTLKSLKREDEYQKIYGRGWGVAMGATLGGTVLGAPLAAATNLPFPIILSGVLAAVAMVSAFTFKEPLQPGRLQERMGYGDIIGGSLRMVRRQRDIRYAILFFGLITIGSIAPIFFFQPFLSGHGVDLGAVGAWQTPMRIAGIAGAVAAHQIIRRMGERHTFWMMPLILIASYTLLGLWDSLYAQVAFPLINFVVVLSQPTVTDYLNRRVPTEQRATVISFTNLIRSIALIPTAPLLGVMADETSLTTSFLVGGGLIALLTLPLMLLWMPFLSRAGEEQEPPLERVAAPPAE